MNNEHKEELINNMVDYLLEIWRNEEREEIESGFRHIGFTKEDMKEYRINEYLDDREG